MRRNEGAVKITFNESTDMLLIPLTYQTYVDQYKIPMHITNHLGYNSILPKRIVKGFNSSSIVSGTARTDSY